MKTKKAILMELAEKIFETVEDEIMTDDDAISVTFTFDSEGSVDILAQKFTNYEIDLDDLE